MSFRDFTRFFRNEQEEALFDAANIAQEVLGWMSQSYHEKFERWLEQEASKPFDIGKPQVDIIQAAVRANTLREVRQHLSRLRVGAQAAMERAKEVGNA